MCHLICALERVDLFGVVWVVGLVWYIVFSVRWDVPLQLQALDAGSVSPLPFMG